MNSDSVVDNIINTGLICIIIIHSRDSIILTTSAIYDPINQSLFVNFTINMGNAQQVHWRFRCMESFGLGFMYCPCAPQSVCYVSYKSSFRLDFFIFLSIVALRLTSRVLFSDVDVEHLCKVTLVVVLLINSNWSHTQWMYFYKECKLFPELSQFIIVN